MRCLADDEYGFWSRKRGVWPTTARLWPNTSAADSVHSPPPCGEGLGVGVVVWGNISASPHHPPPPTPPPAGCGLARFRQILEVTKPRKAGVWLGGGSTPSVGREQTRVRQQHRPASPAILTPARRGRSWRLRQGAARGGWRRRRR